MAKQADSITYIENELLAYLLTYHGRASSDYLHKSIVTFFSPEDITKAKEVFWNEYSDLISTPIVSRRDGKESAAFKDATDIIKAVQAMDKAQQLSDNIIFFIRRCDKIPSFTPEELNMCSMLQRLASLENAVQDITIQQATDHKSLSNRVLVLERPYAKAVKTTSQSPPVHQSPPVNQPQHATPLLPSAPPQSPVIDVEGECVLNQHTGQSDDDDDKSSQSSSNTTDEEEGYTFKSKFTDPVKSAARVIMFTDSIAKYVKPSVFFGSRQTKIYRTNSLPNTCATLDSFVKCDDLEAAIIHIGIRDCRSAPGISSVVKQMETLMQSALSKYKNAVIMFSSALMTSDTGLNTTLMELNEHMRSFCKSHRQFVFVEHRKLQKADHCFEDNIHLNSEEGTKTFVKDLTSTFARVERSQSNRHGTVTVTKSGQRRVSMNNDNDNDSAQLIKLLTLKLLSQM